MNTKGIEGLSGQYHRVDTEVYELEKENERFTMITARQTLGNLVYLMGYKVFYVNITMLLAKLKMRMAEGSNPHEISRIELQGLLILDGFQWSGSPDEMGVC